jgi:hypothetical protein
MAFPPPRRHRSRTMKKSSRMMNPTQDTAACRHSMALMSRPLDKYYLSPSTLLFYHTAACKCLPLPRRQRVFMVNSRALPFPKGIPLFFSYVSHITVDNTSASNICILRFHLSFLLFFFSLVISRDRHQKVGDGCKGGN